MFKVPAKKAEREKQFEEGWEDMLALAKGVVTNHKASKAVWDEIFSHYFNTAEEAVVLKVSGNTFLRPHSSKKLVTPEVQLSYRATTDNHL